MPAYTVRLLFAAASLTAGSGSGGRSGRLLLTMLPSRARTMLLAMVTDRQKQRWPTRPAFVSASQRVALLAAATLCSSLQLLQLLIVSRNQNLEISGILGSLRYFNRVSFTMCQSHFRFVIYMQRECAV